MRFPTEAYLGSIIAHAGPDVCTTVTSENGLAAVHMDPSATAVSGGGAATYLWSWGSGQSSSKIDPILHLAPGVHGITFTATDDDGTRDTDTMVVSVRVGPGPKPKPPWLPPWCSGGAPGLEVAIGLALAGLGAMRRRRRKAA